MQSIFLVQLRKSIPQHTAFGCIGRVDPFDYKPLFCPGCLLLPFGTTEVPELHQLRFHKKADIGTIPQTTTETRIFSSKLAHGKYSRILFWYIQYTWSPNIRTTECMCICW